MLDPAVFGFESSSFSVSTKHLNYSATGVPLIYGCRAGGRTFPSGAASRAAGAANPARGVCVRSGIGRRQRPELYLRRLKRMQDPGTDVAVVGSVEGLCGRERERDGEESVSQKIPGWEMSSAIREASGAGPCPGAVRIPASGAATPCYRHWDKAARAHRTSVGRRPPQRVLAASDWSGLVLVSDIGDCPHQCGGVHT